MRILHLADLHLGWLPRFLGERQSERRQERDGLLARAVDYAVEPRHNIGLVLIAGDLFDTHRPEQPLVEWVIRQLRRLVEAGVQLVTLPGNHDEITYHNSVYREQAGNWPGVLVQNPGPELVCKLEVQGDPCCIYSLAYTGGLSPTGSPLTEFPRLESRGWHIGLFHGSLDWKEGDRSLSLSSAGLAKAGYHYVALGHLHGHRVVPLARGPAVYAGAVEAKGFSDQGVGFFTVVTLGQEGVRLERVDAGARPCRVVSLDVGLCATPDELVSRLRSLGDARAMVRVMLQGTANFSFEVDRLAHSLRHLFYHLELVDQVTALSPGALAAWSQDPSIRGLFIRRLEEKLARASNDRERRVLVRALLNGLASLRAGDG